MNSASLLQVIGNICAVIAAIIYLLPLHKLVREYAHQHTNQNEWVRSALFVLVPLWLLLAGALFCATASGGFDSLRLDRPLLYALTVAATLALGVVSFVFVAMYIQPGFAPRILFSPAIYIIPFATLLLAVLLLNPQFAPGVSRHWFRLPWFIAATLCLVACCGFFGYRLVTTGGSQIRGLVHAYVSNSELSQKNLSIIPTLDPKRDFTRLLNLADESQGLKVRDAALAQLQRNSDFVSLLVSELEKVTPSMGSLDEALAVVDLATFTVDEQKRLALPARKAMERSIKHIHSQFGYFLKDKHRRKAAYRWGTRLFTSIATKFAGTGVDFQPALARFEKIFTSAQYDR